MKIQVGDTVVWESQALLAMCENQAQVVWKKEKSGRVIAIVPEGASIEDVWPEAKNIPKSRKKWSVDVDQFDRAVVEVMRKNERECDYYAPRLSMLRKEETDATGRADG